MLYVTTRDYKDAYTVHKTMLSDLAPDSGAFVPFQIPALNNEEMETLLKKSTGEIIATILNCFFTAKLTGWSVDLAIGRNSLKTVNLSQKVIIAETWRNPGYSYQYVVDNLYKLLSDSSEISKTPTNWVRVAIKISLLFATYASVIANETLRREEVFDVSVGVEDFTDPIAVWYAKQMGMPVEMIICATTDNDAVWDLIHRSQIATSNLSVSLSSGLERLIYNVYGQSEAVRFAETAQARRIYSIDPETDILLSDSYFCSVVGTNRAETVINSLSRTDNYTLVPETAIVYGALQDYRAKTGENRTTLLFSNQCPDQ